MTTCPQCGKELNGTSNVCQNCWGKQFNQYPQAPRIIEIWQICPICKGHGIDETTMTTNSVNPCPVCKGKRIISIIDGKPPME